MRPLIADVSLAPSRSDQHLIALWCAKTAMVCDCLRVEARRFYTQEERGHLRTRLLPPSNTLAWVGRYGRSNILWAEGSNLYGTIAESDSGDSKGYATTLVIGRLVLQIVTIIAKPPEQRGGILLYGRAGPWDRLLASILPASVFEWPPPLSLNEESDLPRLHARFAGTRLGPEPSDWF